MKTILISALISILAFSCYSSKKLQGTNGNIQGEWQLKSIEGMAPETISPNKKPFIRFDTVSARITGSTGCNSFSGALKVDGMNIDFTQPFMMTKMFCEGVDENKFMNTLQRVREFNMPNENGLELKSGDTVLFTFIRLPSYSFKAFACRVSIAGPVPAKALGW